MGFDEHRRAGRRVLCTASVASQSLGEGRGKKRRALQAVREAPGIKARPRQDGHGRRLSALDRCPTAPGTQAEDTTDRGQEVTCNQCRRITLMEDDGKLVGKGQRGSGEVIELNGRVNGQQITGAVAHTTSAINVFFAGIAASCQITAEDAGSGAGQRLTGTVVFLR